MNKLKNSDTIAAMENFKNIFAEKAKQTNVKRMKLVLPVGGVGLNLFFWALDLIVTPDLAYLFLKLRLSAAGICFLAYLLILTPWLKNVTKKRIELIIFITFYSVAIEIALMIRHYGGYASPYYAGLLIVLLVHAISVILPPYQIILTHIGIVLLYLIPSIFIDKAPDLRPFVSNCFFLISIAFFASLFSVLNYFQQYRLFMLTQNIEEQNKKLKELDELKSKFFSNITHELRTPLTLITTPLENMLSSRGEIPEHAKAQLEIMYNNSLKLMRLINTVLDLSKIEAKAMKLSPQKGDFSRFIEYLTGSFDSMVKQKGIKLNFEKASSLEEFPFDKEKIENIFVNLVFNAVKFTSQGGAIKITAGRHENYAFMSVQDTGIGIKKEKIPLIFDRFTQIDDSHKKEYSGTGIGLAIVKELVELHKGNVAVESEEGRGTKFTVYIPINMEETMREPELKQQDITKIIAKKALYSEDIGIKKIPSKQPITEKTVSKNLPIILAIDDNEDMLSVINETLKDIYNVVCVNDSLEGLKTAPDIHPDIIISDLMMPKIDGIELCQMLKKDPRTNRIPFVLLTAKADLSDKIKGLELGLDDYLFKPFHPAELRARIASMLRLKQLSDQLEEKKEKLEELNLTLQDLAVKDPLTGVYNRRHFYNLFEQAIEQKKYSHIGLIILDIDHFKKYNDTNGHLSGDIALKKVVDTIQSAINERGKIFRYGGEEFLIFLPDKDKIKSMDIAEAVRKAVEEEHFTGEEILPGKKLTISLGAGAYPQDGNTIDKILSNIDEALYKAKKTRNTAYPV